MKTNKFPLVLLSAVTLWFAMVSCSDLPDINETPTGSSSSQDSSSSVAPSEPSVSSSSAEVSSSSSSTVLVESSSSGTVSSSSDIPAVSSSAISSSSVAPATQSSSSVEASSSSVASSSSSEVVAGSSSSLVTGKIWNGQADTTWFTNHKTDRSEYHISTAEQLAGLALLVNGNIPYNNKYDMSGKTIKLDADIILNDTLGWENWDTNNPDNINTWTPIGRSSASSSSDAPFKGIFDGNGHLVIGVYSKNTNSDFVGLFGAVRAETAIIKNVGVVASYVSGKDYVGLVVGYFWGTISDSYSRGIVRTNNGSAGGLAGAGNTSTIKNCYSTSIVTNSNNHSDNRIGGLLGIAYSNTKIMSSYSIGKVEKIGTLGLSGGLVGYLFGGNSVTITDGYYDKDTSGQTDSNKGTPMTTVDMQDQSFATLLGDAFKYNPGGYPLLTWQ